MQLWIMSEVRLLYGNYVANTPGYVASIVYVHIREYNGYNSTLNNFPAHAWFGLFGNRQCCERTATVAVKSYAVWNREYLQLYWITFFHSPTLSRGEGTLAIICQKTRKYYLAITLYWFSDSAFPLNRGHQQAFRCIYKIFLEFIWLRSPLRRSDFW